MIPIRLNLLSPDQREYLHFEYVYLHVRSITFLLLTFTIITTGLLLAARIMLQDNYASVLTATTAVNDKNHTLDKDIVDLNKNLQDVQRIQDDFVKWSSILIDVNRAIPENIELTSLVMEKSTRIFTMSGRAQTRDNFLKLKANLEALPYFDELKSPLTNLLLKEDVQFEFTGKIRAGELKSAQIETQP
jgi:Tfp pilus assembly protein PilN